MDLMVLRPSRAPLILEMIENCLPATFVFLCPVLSHRGGYREKGERDRERGERKRERREDMD